MFQKGVHFIADVYDPREAKWLRFDGMNAGGRGMPIEPSAGRITHNGGRYFPVVAVYVCDRPPAPAPQVPQHVVMERH